MGENPQPTPHPRIFSANEEFLDLTTLETHLTQIKGFAKEGNTKQITNSLRSLVAGYHPQS